MSVSQKEVFRFQLPGRRGEAAVCRMKPMAAIDRLRFARDERAVLRDRKGTLAYEQWRRCLRSVRTVLPQLTVRILLPAAGSEPRICRLAERVWDEGDLTGDAQALIGTVCRCAEGWQLTYDEIWLIPQALRLCAARHFMEDTAAFRRNEGMDEAWSYRIGKVRQLMDCIESIDSEKLILALSCAEPILRQDPAQLYERMAVGSRQSIRRIVGRVAILSECSETAVAEAALSLCRSGASPDLTQVFLSDSGLALLQDALRTPHRKRFLLHPDEEGKRIIIASIALFAFLTALFYAFSGSILLTLSAIPLLWHAGRRSFERCMERVSHSVPLPEMTIDSVPEQMRTLVVIPARVADERELSMRMEELAAAGALYEDENLEFLLLADFADSVYAHQPEDDALMEAAERKLHEINSTALRGRGHVLWRERVWNAADGLFQPYERKRGALMALFVLLTGEKSELFPLTTADELRRKRFRYCITMDAGTLPMPGSFLQLIGMMAWPGNPYAVIQPAMRNVMRRSSTPLERMFAQDSGIAAYPGSIGNIYQDQTGRGIYAGKGIIDIRAFRLALENRLPENQILSHDLIEGALAGAGFASGAIWLEEQPATLKGRLTRFERWTRGDWQLLPLLLDRRQPLDALARFQMADNLLQSMLYPAAMLSLAGAAACGSPFAAVVTAAVLYLPLLLHPRGISEERLLRLLSDIALMPVYAFTAVTAIARALFRTYVSRRHLLDWKTAAASDQAGNLPWGLFAAADLLLLPGLRFPQLRIGFLAWMALFALAPVWVNLSMKGQRREVLSEEQTQCLREIARSTWRYFERYTNDENHHLPPDNVQTGAEVRMDARSSPTNIGMYLASCLCAVKLGLLDCIECEKRIAATLDALEKLPKWRGHLYNWYDIRTLLPLEPVEVSSVDSGNLACCLMILSCADLPEEIRCRAASLAEAMEFSALYDQSRKLFRVLGGPSSDEEGGACYDLYASESRLLSLAAIALGHAPAEHWQKLGRPAKEIIGQRLYLSWSGTMFEYLMPDLFFTAPESSAWQATSAAAVKIQRQSVFHGLWGVSESGCCDRDLTGNYGYRAFGLPEIGCSDDVQSGVVAPYAAALALKYAPAEAADLLMRYRDCGYGDECGLWEAVDFRSGIPQPVCSHMAHHQGMLLCAIANALCEDFLPETAMRNPRFRAITPLLQERMP